MKKDLNEQLLSEEQLETVHGGTGKVKWVAHCKLCGWISEVPEENINCAVGRAKGHTYFTLPNPEKHDTFYYTPSVD